MLFKHINIYLRKKILLIIKKNYKKFLLGVKKYKE